MKIKVSDIQESHNIKYREDDLSFFGMLGEDSSGDIKINEPVAVDIDIVCSQGQFYITGNIKGRMRLKCSRCLEDFRFPFDTKFSLTLMEREDEDFSDIHEIELTHDDLKIEQFSGEELDITRIVQEQIVLLCPMQPLCREDCKGLCPQCGTNLNETECSCAPLDDDNPFSALKDLE